MKLRTCFISNSSSTSYVSYVNKKVTKQVKLQLQSPLQSPLQSQSQSNDCDNILSKFIGIGYLYDTDNPDNNPLELMISFLESNGLKIIDEIKEDYLTGVDFVPSEKLLINDTMRKILRYNGINMSRNEIEGLMNTFIQSETQSISRSSNANIYDSNLIYQALYETFRKLGQTVIEIPVLYDD